MVNHQEDKEEHGTTPTSELYGRIQRLSEQLRVEFEDLECQETNKPMTLFYEDRGRHSEVSEGSNDLDSQTPGNGSEEMDEAGLQDSSGKLESARTEANGSTQTGYSCSSDSTSEQQYRHVVDPKLHRALEKMKKLDAKLADLTKVKYYGCRLLSSTSITSKMNGGV